MLPFVNMSGDPEQEYFSDGITEDIITDLSKVSALLVIARNTAFTFKGKVMDVKEVARSLDVSHVLEGSVRKAGDRVRITAQLIDAGTGGHVWADRYDRDLTDIFAIQDEISKAIVAALRVKLLPDEKRAIETRGTSSVEAYNLYLMARQQWVSGSYGEIRRDETIVRICKQAVSFDPEYAEAWALMAIAQSELRFWHGKDIDPLPAAERALTINPDLAEARCVKARKFEEEGRQEEANAEIAKALQLDPESWEVNREAARLMFRQGRIDDAIPFFEKAASLVDTDWHNPTMLLTCYHAKGAADELRRAAQMTLERAEKAIMRDPASAPPLAGGANALAILGEEQRAREWVDRALLLDPDNLSMRYNLACAMIVELKDADRAMELMQPYFEQIVSPTFIKHLEADPGSRRAPRRPPVRRDAGGDQAADRARRLSRLKLQQPLDPLDSALVGLHQRLELGLVALAVERDADRTRQRRGDLLERFLLVLAGDAAVGARPDQQPAHRRPAGALQRDPEWEQFVVGVAIEHILARRLVGHHPAQHLGRRDADRLPDFAAEDHRALGRVDADRARQRRRDLLERFLLVLAGDAAVGARPDQQPAHRRPAGCSQASIRSGKSLSFGWQSRTSSLAGALVTIQPSTSVCRDADRSAGPRGRARPRPWSHARRRRPG